MITQWKEKKQNKCYRAPAVTLILCLKISIKYFVKSHFSNMLITTICATNYCLINSVINTLTTLLRRTFLLCVLRAYKLWKMQCEDLQLSYFTKRGRNMFSVIRNLFIQGNMCQGKKRNPIINSIINLPCK